MTTRPILFSAPMIRALLAGRKTQTRRVIKPQPDKVLDTEPYWFVGGFRLRPMMSNPLPCPYGSPGDLLWVRETWGINDYRYGGTKPIPKARPGDLKDENVVYFATEDDCEIQADMPARPSIHMPRWASRLTLEITGVKVERLHAISEADVWAEGLHPDTVTKSPVGSFQLLWESINGEQSWRANPWVWALTFNVHQQNVDAFVEQQRAA